MSRRAIALAQGVAGVRAAMLAPQAAPAPPPPYNPKYDMPAAGAGPNGAVTLADVIFLLQYVGCTEGGGPNSSGKLYDPLYDLVTPFGAITLGDVIRLLSGVGGVQQARSLYQRPFSSASIWNVPLGDSCRLVAAGIPTLYDGTLAIRADHCLIQTSGDPVRTRSFWHDPRNPWATPLIDRTAIAAGQTWRRR